MGERACCIEDTFGARHEAIEHTFVRQLFLGSTKLVRRIERLIEGGGWVILEVEGGTCTFPPEADIERGGSIPGASTSADAY